MNEFEGKPKEFLKSIMMNLESYKQGCDDTFKIYEDVYKRTMKVYEEKIRLCEIELNKD